MAKRYDYMDWLRVLSIFAVVGIHVISRVVNHTPPTEWQWQYAHALGSTLRWCVPVFFMLSGALLLTRKPDEPVWSFLKKRLAKAFVPLIFWSAVYIAYRIFQQDRSYTVWEAVQLFFGEDIYFHLWFLYTIIGLYLMAPFLRILVHNMNQKTFLYFLGFWFLFTGIFPVLKKFLQLEMAFPAGMFEPYIGYFMLGAYLFLYPISKKWLPLLGVLAAAGIFVTLFGNLYLTDKAGEFDGFFYEHFRPNSMAITLFVFVLFQHLAPRIKPNPLITKLSLATLGIYVIHPLVQVYLNLWFGLNESTINPIIGIPFLWLLIYSISFGIILILQKLPVIKYIVP
ncbi:acyltransferase [Planomicrobium sp. CPCC 101110]|uniref:acyltransferase n=1 Tax=Planomicrobium sp. CPCC 101110 TaxID=2599619 RepID=UPI0011B67677|nr:acyltransferase family protein [Planomicrobium sp. CPCC 101110]TWT27703.1 acyltransferase family protein [Planomicrobium sp. CPCC 101110]